MKRITKILLGSALSLGLAVTGGVILSGCGKKDVSNQTIQNQEVVETYNISFDYGQAKEFFNDTVETKSVESNESITGLPTIKEEYQNAFLGWFIANTDTQITENDIINGNVTLEARFDVSKNAPSGLYQNKKMTKTWAQIVQTYPDAFRTEGTLDAAYYSSYLTSLSGVLVIDNSIESISYFAFYSCSSLTSITIPNSVKSIDYNAFEGCTSLTSITIPDSVESIDYYAFSNCTSLTSITIPNSVTEIMLGAFSGCTVLESITVADGNAVYHSDGNCLIETNTKTLLAGCKNSVIPTDGSVTSIYYSAFEGCTNLTSITIPNSVESIGGSAFRYCTNLTSITIPDSVKSIGESAFSGCTSLESITIPNSVTSIGSSAFEGCESLTSITIPNSVENIGNSAFSGCNNLNKVYYKGNASQWSSIKNINYNHDLTNATIYYYNENQPTESGNYWHYDIDGVTPIIWK